MSERAPLFLARASYRSRRISDAARLLPVLALFLLMLPALWPAPVPGGAQVSGTLVYLFALWALLIVMAAVIARLLAPRDPPASGTRP